MALFNVDFPLLLRATHRYCMATVTMIFFQSLLLIFF